MSKKIFYYLITTLIIYSCSKDDSPIDKPQEVILGRWELTNLGAGLDAPPYLGNSGYQEYLPDSVMRILNDDDEGFIYQKYWIKDSLLFERAIYIDDIEKDTIVFTVPYKFQFQNRNKLVLIVQNSAILPVSIYKRVKRK